MDSLSVIPQAFTPRMFDNSGISWGLVLVDAGFFVDMIFIRGLPRIKFHINKDKGVN